MDNPESGVISTGWKAMGNLNKKIGCNSKKHVMWPYLYPVDLVDLNKRFRYSILIDDTQELATVEEMVAKQGTAADQEKETNQEMVKIEDPKEIALLDMGVKAINEQKNSQENFSQFYVLIDGAKIKRLNKDIQDIKVNKNEQNSDSEPEIKKIKGAKDGSDGEKSAKAIQQDIEEKNEQSNDSESKLKMITALHEENCSLIGREKSAVNMKGNKENKKEKSCRLESELEIIIPTKEEPFCSTEGENSHENSNLKRKCEMPINELQEPKLKKVKCDVPEETTEENASVVMRLKRKRDEINSLLGTNFKKPKLDVMNDEKTLSDNEKAEEKPLSDNEKTDKKPKFDDEKADEEYKDDKDKN